MQLMYPWDEAHDEAERPFEMKVEDIFFLHKQNGGPPKLCFQTE